MTPANSWRVFWRAAPWHRPLSIAGALVVLLLAVPWFVREPIDRAAAASLLAMAGARDLKFSALHADGPRFVLDRISFHDQSAHVALEAPQAALTLDWEGTRPVVVLSLMRPHVAVAVDRPAALATLARGVLHVPAVAQGLHLTLSEATIAFAGLRALPLVVEGLSGTVAETERVLTYDVRGAVLEGGRRYPFTAVAGLEGKTVVHRWAAAALPAAALGALLAPSGIELRGGLLRDPGVHFSGPRSLRGAARLVDATVGIDGRTVDGVEGTVAFDQDSFATPQLSGRFGEAPVSLRGEIRFVDLALVRELFDHIANERNLRTVRLEGVADGVVFAKYVTHGDQGPLAVHLLDVDPREPTLRFDTVLAGDHIFSGPERTSSMADRTGAVAGINGDYFDMGGTSAPQGLMIRDGRLLHAPTELRETLVVHRDKSFTFGLYRFHGEVRTSRGSAPITIFNDWPPGDVAVVTPDFGKIPATPNVTFVALAPAARPDRYRVVEVSPLTHARRAAFGLAFGPLVRDELPRRGEEVEVHYALTPPLDDAVAAVASGPLLLKDGRWYEDPHAPAPGERDVRWPVVGVGKLPTGRLLWVAVDGRWYDVSIGMTRPEFAALLQRFGATDAIALDSGGSVTMVSRVPGEDVATVRNHPSDTGGERWVANGLFIYSSATPSPLADVLKSRTVGAAH